MVALTHDLPLRRVQSQRPGVHTRRRGQDVSLLIANHHHKGGGKSAQRVGIHDLLEAIPVVQRAEQSNPRRHQPRIPGEIVIQIRLQDSP